MEANAKIDWISYTVPFDYHDDTVGEHTWVNAIQKTVARDEPTKSLMYIKGNHWEKTRARPPYTWARTQLGVTAMAGASQSEILIEVSGLGCDMLRQWDFIPMALAHENVTRIDIAVDVLCDDRPMAVTEEHIDGNKFKSRSTIISESGETVYVGSRKSSRYMRVYRYDKNHPRKDWLRFEFVLKKEWTASIINQINNGLSVMQIALNLGVQWGITHQAFKFPIVQAEIEGIRGSPKQNKTEQWLIEQCAPAFKRLVRDGKIQYPNQWLWKHFGV